MKYLPLAAVVSLAGASCDNRAQNDSDTQMKNLLSVMEVNVARISLDEPKVISIVTEFDQKRFEVFTPASFEKEFFVAVQPDKDTGRIRIALGNSKQALSSNLTENPYAKRAWIFHNSPSKNVDGSFTIMETVPGELPTAKIVVLTEKP